MSLSVAAAAVGLSACGSQESGPQATTVNLSQNAYVKRPPVTTVPPPAADAVPATIEGEQDYVVQAGDYFAKIAAQFGFSIDQIVQYNKFGSSQHLLKPGDIVKIPPGGKNPAAAPATTLAPATPAAAASDSLTLDDADNSSGCDYTIVAGDWPTKVAKKFKITVEQLETANAGPAYTKFLQGTVLKIPPGGSC